MSQVEPGDIRALLPGRAAAAGRRPGGDRRRPGAPRAARHHALEPPRLVRLLPLQHRPLLGARRPRGRRPRRAGHELADQPGRHRGRGRRHGVAAADGRPAGRLHGRDPGQRQLLHPDGAAVRSRTSQRLRPERRRPAGGAPPLVVYASDQAHSSIGEGRPARGLRRRSPAPARAPTRRTPCAWTCWRRPSGTTWPPACGPAPWSRPSAPRPRRRSTRSAASPSSASATACGCTWTRPWPARP